IKNRACVIFSISQPRRRFGFPGETPLIHAVAWWSARLRGSAAYLKFLHHKRQIRTRNFK
ncbi:MAG: hypothetical protein WAM83_04450, partial [Bradyrhizobium sp.]